MNPKPILFIDNQDSFVWNLVDYVSQFHPETMVVSNQIKPRQVREMNPLGIVISPGPGNPSNSRDIGNCIHIIREFEGTPMLGVCLGHQAIDLAYGGTIARTAPVHGKVSKIIHDGQGIFKNLENPLIGGRYHSLAVRDLAPPLKVSAVTPDGIVMGLRHQKLPMEGLQFHPESVLTPTGKKIISNWLDEVAR
ncbi:MAG: anthranilate synthase component II [Methanotrichaceae archaeon]